MPPFGATREVVGPALPDLFGNAADGTGLVKGSSLRLGMWSMALHRSRRRPVLRQHHDDLRPWVRPDEPCSDVTCNVAPMTSPREDSGVRNRVREHRRRLRAQGLRPVQIWVPDVRSPEFASEAYRQAALVAASEHAEDDQAFIDALSSDGE